MNFTGRCGQAWAGVVCAAAGSAASAHSEMKVAEIVAIRVDRIEASSDVAILTQHELRAAVMTDGRRRKRVCKAKRAPGR
jgi:hypothetical protein